MSKADWIAWLLMFFCMMAFFTYSKEIRLDKLQQGIAEDIIRFHVRANSDSEEDQALKLMVKGRVVEYMSHLTENADDKEQVQKTIEDHISDIENVAKGVIKEQKKEYNVRAYFENSYFPIKTYGDITFPAGNYEAFRIDIGSAKGRNWWCVVYPKLCFVDVTYGVVPDESKEELKGILDEEEYRLITGGDSKSVKVEYEFKIFKFLNYFIKK